jgi:hypothetical protein
MTAPTKRESAEWLACMLIASVGLVYSLWVVPYIPTMDGPQHVLSAHIENHYSDPGSLYPEFYRVLPQYAAKGFALVFGPLESMLPWRVALRVTLSLIALAFAWGFALLVLTLDRNRRPTALLGFVIVLPWPLYMGFFPFVVGTTVGLYTLVYGLRRPPATTVRCAVLSLLLLAQAVCHVFTAILTGAVVAVLAVVAAPAGKRLREAGKMALIGAPAAAVLGLTFRERNLPASEQQLFDWAMAERFSEISRWFVPGPGVRAWLVIGLLVVAVGTTLALPRARRATPTERAMAWLALALLSLTLLTPLHIPGWQCFAPRFAVLATVLGLALLRVPHVVSPRATRALVPFVTAGCLVSALVSANLHRQLAKGCAEVLAGLDAPLHFEGPRLPIVIEPMCGTPREPAQGPIPRASLAYNTPLLYLVEHGGIGTKMFQGVRSIHAIDFVGTRRPPRPDPHAVIIAQSQWVETDPKLRSAVMNELAADGMPFEGVHVVGGRPTDFSIFNDRGYITEFQGDSLFIAHFEGCPAELVLQPGALDRELVGFEVGLFSRTTLAAEPRTLERGVIHRGAPVVDGAIHVPLRSRPCGAVWVRAFWDVDGSSTFTPGDRTCANAHWQGRLRATLARASASVSCVSPP